MQMHSLEFVIQWNIKIDPYDGFLSIEIVVTDVLHFCINFILKHISVQKYEKSAKNTLSLELVFNYDTTSTITFVEGL